MTDEKQFVDAVTSMGGISILAAISRSLISEDRRTIGSFVRDVTCAGFVALMVGGIVADYHFNIDGVNDQNIRNLIIGVFSFCGADILVLLIKITKMAIAHPGALLDWLIDKLIGLRGKK